MVIIKDDVCMKFYNEEESLYLETDASYVGQWAGLLHAWDGLWFLLDEINKNTVLQPMTFAHKHDNRLQANGSH